MSALEASQRETATALDAKPPGLATNQDATQDTKNVVERQGLHSTETSITTPKEAMRQQEFQRVRAMLFFSSFSSLVGAILIPLLGQDPIATWIFVGTIILGGVAGLVLLITVRDAASYRPWMATFTGLLSGLAVAAGYYFFGVTSAVVMVVPIGTYFYALGESYRGALACHANVAVWHAVISALQIARVIPDVGMVSSNRDDIAEQIGITIAIQAIFFGAFVMARSIRLATQRTFEELDMAIKDNARRQALLNEAKQELALAQKIGGPGRFSEQTLGGYKLGNVLGRGAMGEVYAAVQVQTGQLAAVKLLGRESMQRPDIVTRFLREVEIARTLHEDNIVEVLAVSDAEDAMPFLVMERLQGRTLSERLRSDSKMSVDEVAEMMTALARGVSAAHRAGIVHRDLKPSNIFEHRSADKLVWKILDFGVSKFMDAGDTLTAGAIVGTPTYMAPEQAKGEEISSRADVYALGVIAYRTLTGRPAFSGPDLPVILRAVVYDVPPQPSQVAQLPPAIDFILAIAMAKEAKDRFAGAEELSGALVLAAQGRVSEELQLRGAAMMRKYPWGKRNVG